MNDIQSWERGLLDIGREGKLGDALGVEDAEERVSSLCSNSLMCSSRYISSSLLRIWRGRVGFNGAERR